jgi:hypothetical protein
VTEGKVLAVLEIKKMKADDASKTAMLLLIFAIFEDFVA